ncbi:unnamed protein product [Symbiodinium necroappetens]|uniref:Uncharacterized protein n=1 Tax=Symbiodinium necroappetens TaxID=1628268 RepID=A0A813AL42_9DINO|nr:unnamed protein product [Symbiodinium necroappetens]
MHFVVEDGVSSLGLAFSDMPPSPVIISKARHTERQLLTESCQGYQWFDICLPFCGL